MLAGTGLLIAGAIAATSGATALAAGSPGSSGYLGAAEPFAVLGGSTVTNTGAPTSVWGDVGVSPGPAIVGFTTNQVGGAQHAGDSIAADAQTALTSAYNGAAAAPRSDTVDYSAIDNRTFLPGVYKADTGMGLTGTVTLDGRGDAGAVWIFQAGSTLTTASSSRVVVINGNPCNVYWQVGSSATIGSSTDFIGTVMANTSITAVTNARIAGRLLARTAAVTLDSTVITKRACTLTDGSGITIPTPSASPTASSTATPAPSTAATGPAAPGSGTTPAPGRSGSPSARPTSAPSTSGPSPTSSPTALPAGGGSGPDSGTPRLATTGSDVTPPLALAGGLLALGSLLIAGPAVRRSLRRRRSAAEA